MFGIMEGAKGGEQPTHTPIEASDTLRSVSFAKIADLLGEGEIYGFALGFDRAVECIYLNKTPIGNADGTLNYQSVSVDSRSGTQAQTSIPGFSSVDNEVGVGLELKDTIPYTYTTTNLQLSALSVRISLPQGLQKANSNGDITGYSVQYAIDIKVDAGAFVTVLNGAFTGKASIAYERTHRVELPTGATTGWSLRVRRITVNANSASIADITNVVSVTESIDVKLRYPNSAYVFLQLDAAQFPSIPSRAYHIKGRIVKVPSNYDADTRVYSGVWDGTFKLAYTNNPAWVYYDLVLHYRYGLGHLITSAQVDKWSLYPIAQYCDALVPNGKGGTEPRFTCNTYIQTQQQAYSLLQSMATTFRGISFYAGGMVSAVADMPSDPVYTYTHANVVNGVFTYNGSAGKTRYTVALVSWNDPNDFYTQKVQYYQDPDGYRRYGYKPTSMAAFGCTSQAMAARVGKWLTVSSRLEGEGVTFQVGLDGIFALPGQIVRISDRARTLVRMAGRVQTVGSSNSVVKPDVMPTVGVGDSLTVTLPTGVTETRTVSDVSESTITVSPAFSSAPSSQGIWLVENSELTAPMWKITGITEDTSSNGKTFNISAVRHYPGKYDFIDLGVPIDTPPIAGLPSNVMPGPDTVVITSNEVIGAVTAQSILTIHWTKVATATHYNVAWRKDNGDWLDLPVQYGVSVDIPSNSPGIYVAAVRAVNGGGTSSRPVTSQPYQVGDITTLPTKIAAIDDKTTSIQTDLNVVEAAATQMRTDIDAAIAQVGVLQGQVGDILQADEWADTNAYVLGDLVQSTGALYRAVQDVPIGTAITDTGYWEFIGNYASLGEAVSATAAQVAVNTNSITQTNDDITALSQTLITLQATVDTQGDDLTAQNTHINSVETKADNNGLAIQAVATDVSLLGASNGDKTAFILDQNKVQIGGGQTFAQMLTGLQASDAGLGARVDSETAARISGDSANATNITSVSARVGAVEFAQPNILPNPSAANGNIGWTSTVAGFSPVSYQDGTYWYCTSNNGRMHSNDIVFPSGPLTLSADLFSAGISAGLFQIAAACYSGPNATGYLGQAVITAVNGRTAWTRYQASLPAVPAGTNYVQVVFALAGATNTSCAVRNIKLEYGTTATPFTDNATIGGSARVTQALIANVGPGGAYAQATTMLDVNGRITGVSQFNNGTTGDFKILADKFSIESPAGGARTEYSTGNWRVYDSAGVLRVQMGIW